MTALRTQSAHAASTNPVVSGTRQVRGLGKGIPQAPVMPAVNVPLLQAKYGPDTAAMPRPKTGVFRVPLNTPEDAYERLKMERLRVWLDVMERRGWLWTGERIVIPAENRRYPAHFEDGSLDLGSVELGAVTTFVYQHARTIRTEMKPEWLEPTLVAH